MAAASVSRDFCSEGPSKISEGSGILLFPYNSCLHEFRVSFFVDDF